MEYINGGALCMWESSSVSLNTMDVEKRIMTNYFLLSKDRQESYYQSEINSE